MSLCEKCGGTGVQMVKTTDGNFKYQKCSCITIHQTETVLDKRHLTSEWLETHIPNPHLRNEVFNVNILETEIARRGIAVGNDFLNYKLHLQGIIEHVKNGKLPTNSLYIYAPEGFGKKTFAYTFMKEAYQQGYNVSKIYTLTQLCAYKRKYERENLNNIFEQENIDVLFVSSGHLFYKDEIWMLRYLLDECELRGIVLVFLSKYPARHLYKMDPTFEYVIDTKITRLGAYNQFQYISVSTSYESHK